jgi:Uma2 family endonuclease
MTVAVPIQAPTTFAAPTVLPGPAPVENRIVLDGVSWDQYEQILDAMGERRIRLTYDRGTLEIMTVSSPPERPAALAESPGRLLTMK